MYQQQSRKSMGGLGTPTQQYSQGLKGARTRDRTPSASTVASNRPESPFSYTMSYPHIANPEYTPQSPAGNVWDPSGSQFDQASFSFSKRPFNPNDAFFMNASDYKPNQAAHTPAVHLAIKGVASDHQNLENMPSELPYPSRQSMSSAGQGSPATPLSTARDVKNKLFEVNRNGEGAVQFADM